MARMTIKDLAAQVELLTEVVSQLAHAQAAAVTAPVETAPSKKAKAEAKADEVFEAKFKVQLKRAKALAKKNGTGAKLVYVNGTSVWYMSESRRTPSGGVLLATVRPDGTVKTEVNGLERLVA